MSELPTFKFAPVAHLRTLAESFLPTRGTDRSTGWDVKAAFPNREPMSIRPGSHVKIPLGIRIFAPEGWWLELRPRSSTFGKKHLNCLYGVIDEDYEGELIFACQYLPDITAFGNDLVINFGDAIGQIIPVRRQEMIVEHVSNKDFDELCRNRKAQRGAGGFGSTGK
jgi:dUTP pyrophosphatase